VLNDPAMAELAELQRWHVSLSCPGGRPTTDDVILVRRAFFGDDPGVKVQGFGNWCVHLSKIVSVKILWHSIPYKHIEIILRRNWFWKVGGGRLLPRVCECPTCRLLSGIGMLVDPSPTMMKPAQ